MSAAKRMTPASKIAAAAGSRRFAAPSTELRSTFRRRCWHTPRCVGSRSPLRSRSSAALTLSRSSLRCSRRKQKCLRRAATSVGLSGSSTSFCRSTVSGFRARSSAAESVPVLPPRRRRCRRRLSSRPEVAEPPAPGRGSRSRPSLLRPEASLLCLPRPRLRRGSLRPASGPGGRSEPLPRDDGLMRTSFTRPALRLSIVFSRDDPRSRRRSRRATRSRQGSSRNRGISADREPVRPTSFR